MTNPKIGLMTDSKTRHQRDQEFQSVMGRDGFEIIALFDMYTLVMFYKRKKMTVNVFGDLVIL